MEKYESEPLSPKGDSLRTSPRAKNMYRTHVNNTLNRASGYRRDGEVRAVTLFSRKELRPVAIRVL